MMHKCYCTDRSSIEANNKSVSRNYIVFRHEIVTKLPSAAEFFAAEDLAFPKSVALLRRNIQPETQEKLLLRRKIFFAMSLMTKLTLAQTLNDLNDDA